MADDVPSDPVVFVVLAQRAVASREGERPALDLPRVARERDSLPGEGGAIDVEPADVASQAEGPAFVGAVLDAGADKRLEPARVAFCIAGDG